MIIEEIATGNTIDEAIKSACSKLNKTIDELNIEILDMPKKSFLGKIKVPAKIKATFVQDDIDISIHDTLVNQTDSNFNEELNYKIDICKQYITNIIKHMGYENVELSVNKKDNNTIHISLDSDENMGYIIGRRGETIDALQYLTSLVCNKGEKDYLKVFIDSCNYREKRENTLIELAKKISNYVIKTGKKSVLEAMNSYERRLIHSVISDIDGVHSKSIGDEPDRKIIVFPNKK